MRKSILSVTLLAFCVSGLSGQSFDEKRMERDLKVAENILSTLINGDGRSLYRNKVESNYIADFGVIFSVPRFNYVYSGSPSSILYDEKKSGKTYVITLDDEDYEDDDEDEGSSRRRKGNRREPIELDVEEELQDDLTDFLVDYADLIGQIKPSERIVVQTRNSNNRIFFSGGQLKNEQNTSTAYVIKSDLSSYKQGKISREEMVEKVVFQSPDENEKASKDLELFATIFARLYGSDLSSTYYVSSRSIGYTSLDGFGVTFNMKVYSSSGSDGLHTILTTGETNLSMEERNEKVNAMYPEFEQSLKENLMDYGRTIKSLNPDEMLVLDVSLTECTGCEMPSDVELSVKAKTLQDYDKGSISREDGIKKINVKKKRN